MKRPWAHRVVVQLSFPRPTQPLLFFMPLFALSPCSCLNSSQSHCPSPYSQVGGAVNLAGIRRKGSEKLLMMRAYVLPLNVIQELCVSHGLILLQRVCCCLALPEQQTFSPFFTWLMAISCLQPSLTQACIQLFLVNFTKPLKILMS